MLRRFLVFACWLGVAGALMGAPHTVRKAGTSTVSAYREAGPRPAAPPVRYHGYGSDGPERPWAGRGDPSFQPTHTGPAHFEGRRPWWNLGLGVFNVPQRDGLDAGRVEYRSARPILGGYWLGGVTLGPDDFVLPYAGFHWDLPLGERFTFTPATSFGFLSGGDAARFGGSLQFRTSLELAYEVAPGQRLGFAVQHVSNAQLEQPNLGANTQLLTYSVAIGP